MGVADVNNDGKPDLLANDYVLLGNGDGTFQSAQTYSSGESALWFMTGGDITGDRKSDIVTVNNDSQIAVLLGNGDGTFQPPVVPARATFDQSTDALLEK